jgi:hypothetical protein
MCPTNILWRIARQRLAKHALDRYALNENRRVLLDNELGYHGNTGVSGTILTWTAGMEPFKAVICTRFSGIL